MERGERPIDVELLLRVAELSQVELVVLRPQEEHLLADIASLSPADFGLASKILQMLPHLHPLRRADLEALIENWSRSSHSIQDQHAERIVKKM